MDFSLGISVSDFHRLRRDYAIPTGFAAGVLETPFSYCAVGAYMQVVKWVRTYVNEQGAPLDGSIGLVYDRNERDWGHFIDIMKKEFDIEPIPRSTTEAVPLQLADMLAWEHARWHNTPERDPRKSLLAMADRLPGGDAWAFATWDKLEEYCKEKRFQKRSARTA